MKRLLLAALAVCALGAAAAPPDFAYDRTAPLALTTVAVQRTDGAETRDITYRSGDTTITASIIRPASAGSKRPGILFVHWLGEPQTTNRTEFMADARALAKRGATSLLVDAMWSQPHWFESHRSTDTDYAQSIAQVIALRRALDVLVAQPDVDATRIAYAGHDFGAMYGALLAAVDARPKFYVFETPTISFWEWYLLGDTPANAQAYLDQMAALDLPRWLPQATMTATLLQFAKRDDYVAASTAISFRNIVPDRDRTMKSYDADHALADATATSDRLAWLVSHLGLK
jgi:dienelactone hydrolase